MMRIFKSSIIVLVLSCTLGSVGFSDTTPPKVLKEFRVNPVQLRERLLSDSLTVLEAATKVHQAKNRLNVTRMQLLPSLNLSTLLGTTTNPTFALSTVEYLVPFLVPARWFNMVSAKNLMEAERIGFLLSELNVLSSLYSMYQQTLSDFRSRDFLAQNLRDAILVESIVARNYEIGHATEADLNIARSQTLMAQVQLDRFGELLVQEIASIREALALPSETEIILEESVIPPSVLEVLSVNDAIALSLQGAPEYQQIEFLTRSAKMDRWSKIFGFVSGMSGMNSVTGIDGKKDASFNLNQQIGYGRFNFGFDYFAQIGLSNRNLDLLLIHQEQIGDQIGKTVEILLGRLTYIQNRAQESEQSESLLRSVFENQKQRYSIGEASLQDLIHSQASLRQASLEKLHANTDLNLLRITLHRLLRADQFASVRGCETLAPLPENIPTWKFWKRFKKKKDAPICDPGAVKKRFSGDTENVS